MIGLTSLHRASNRDLQVQDLLSRPAITRKLRNLDVPDSVRASGLIENIIFQMPIAQLTLRDLPSGETALLDGDWRVSTLKSFVDGDFALEEMDYFPNLNDKKFSELPAQLQRRILETYIHCVILDVDMTDRMVARYLRQIRS